METCLQGLEKLKLNATYPGTVHILINFISNFFVSSAFHCPTVGFLRPPESIELTQLYFKNSSISKTERTSTPTSYLRLRQRKDVWRKSFEIKSSLSSRFITAVKLPITVENFPDTMAKYGSKLHVEWKVQRMLSYSYCSSTVDWLGFLPEHLKQAANLNFPPQHPDFKIDGQVWKIGHCVWLFCYTLCITKIPVVTVIKNQLYIHLIIQAEFSFHPSILCYVYLQLLQ